MKISDVYEEGLNFIKQSNKNLVKNLSKSLGHSTGLEYKDRYLDIISTNTSIIKKDMIFLINPSFEGLNDKNN